MSTDPSLLPVTIVPPAHCGRTMRHLPHNVVPHNDPYGESFRCPGLDRSQVAKAITRAGAQAARDAMRAQP